VETLDFGIGRSTGCRLLPLGETNLLLKLSDIRFDHEDSLFQSRDAAVNRQYVLTRRCRCCDTAAIRSVPDLEHRKKEAGSNDPSYQIASVFPDRFDFHSRFPSESG
jgi:hypothetical protein